MILERKRPTINANIARMEHNWKATEVWDLETGGLLAHKPTTGLYEIMGYSRKADELGWDQPPKKMSKHGRLMPYTKGRWVLKSLWGGHISYWEEEMIYRYFRRHSR